MPVCPSCQGGKKSIAFSYRGEAEGCAVGPVDCFTCRGTGEVDEGYAARKEAGERLRRERLDANLTMREAAANRGISVVQYSDLENARTLRV